MLLKHRSGKVEVGTQPYSYGVTGIVLEDPDGGEQEGDAGEGKEADGTSTTEEVKGVQVEGKEPAAEGSLTDALHDLGRQFDEPPKNASVDAERPHARSRVALRMA